MYLLDTAVFCASALTPEVLPARIRDVIGREGPKALCEVSLLEVAIHFRLGRLKLGGTLAEFFRNSIGTDVCVVDITPATAEMSNMLPPGFPGDPFDRTIVATARVMNLTLITADKDIRDARCCSLEFYPFRPSRMH